jgi:hypothetical protein
MNGIHKSMYEYVVTAKETYLDQVKDGEIDFHDDGTRLDGL